MSHQPDQELGRIVVIGTSASYFELHFFDKTLQTDEVALRLVEIGPGAVHMLGAAVVAWQLQGVIVTTEY
jgi:hypothetical protein